ncbi:polyphosphate kinase 1 [Saprospiraceae bacterium]|nr:polyphosphate kinase 1 [Saprospiraceae bacterium]
MSKSKLKYYNRDLSWLRFNNRVLQEMEDERNPLSERVKFAAIFSSNLDEFFEVRVAEIRRIKSLDKPLRKKLITKPNKLLRKIKKNVNALEAQYSDSFFNKLIPQLKDKGFNLVLKDDFNNEIKDFCKSYFKEHIEAILKSKSLFKTDEDRLFIKSGRVYLVGCLGETFAVYELPSDHNRFIEVKTNTYIFLDDLIRIHLEEKYKTEFYSIKASRDAELYIQDEYSGNLRDLIESSLPNRDTGQFTTAMIDQKMPEKMLQLLYETLDISDTDIIFGGTYHKLVDLFSLEVPETVSEKIISLEPIRSSKLACFGCILDAVREKDRLLYFPYESFDEVVRFLSEASEHPQVSLIKITLYRVSKTSAIAKGLLKALENGKSVVVFIETKARFDESNNMYWGDKLSKAGAKVMYSYPNIKVHSKVMYFKLDLLDGNIEEFAYIGTGNFNEKTSKVYTDYGLMTAHKKITSEIGQVFQLLERNIIVPKLKKLLVSPFNTRKVLSELIDKEIARAQAGEDAYIILKMNSLQDKGMINLLYEASSAGVRVQLLIRGICCLVPGVIGMSENIHIVSVVDRFLEHGRVYIFGNGGKEIMYIGSADMMTRNLDHRVEVLTPILDADIHEKIKATLDLQFDDQVKARLIDRVQSNRYQNNIDDYKKSSQHQIYQYLENANESENISML